MILLARLNKCLTVNYKTRLLNWMDCSSAGGYVLNAKTNNAFIAVNDLLKAGVTVYRLPDGVSGNSKIPTGSFYVPAGGKAKQVLEKSGKELGLTVTGVSKTPGSVG
jgi:hypothetical protein